MGLRISVGSIDTPAPPRKVGCAWREDHRGPGHRPQTSAASRAMPPETPVDRFTVFITEPDTAPAWRKALAARAARSARSCIWRMASPAETRPAFQSRWPPVALPPRFRVSARAPLGRYRPVQALIAWPPVATRRTETRRSVRLVMVWVLTWALMPRTAKGSISRQQLGRDQPGYRPSASPWPRRPSCPSRPPRRGWRGTGRAGTGRDPRPARLQRCGGG